jgi:hypothetical protein
MESKPKNHIVMSKSSELVFHLFDILTGRCHRCGKKYPKGAVCYTKKYPT